ncbi:hypothetical protein BJ322DRAFT_1108988 [Thelephora terrestris]|uniref:NB-ARC domain-containing protein n=1 Tax=Thelephora terrestris TaxID=56493 RepID=A0A9P6L760_9AGAM|nr:hypothetical protein BJ322DRAFT_1108988 [Thelephora terrestris]
MDPKSQRKTGRDKAISMLNVAIDFLNLARVASSVTPATIAFGTAGSLLSLIRDSMANRGDYVALGLACADICRALERGLDGRRANQLNGSVIQAIEQLTMAMAQIQESVIELGKRNPVSRVVHATSDKNAVAGWKSELDRILQIFKTELALHTDVEVSDTRQDVANTHKLVSDIHCTVVKGQEGNQTTPARIHGEAAPPPPRACFGRGDLIEKIVGFVENLTPIALVGTGGIGKTSVALTVLHDDRVKSRFGENRRFIRCDQFQAAQANLLNRLSKVIGAGIENPEDLTPLRPFLSSKEMLIVLDNAESILDPEGADAQKIYAVVEELSQIGNISLCITTRITTIPLDCERLDVPTLSMDAARSAFYRIYGNDERPNVIDDILKQLDFHPLSVILLAAVARQHNWDSSRLGKEWDLRQTSVLNTEHKNSLAATIELSLASPMFRELGPNARDFLEVVAFFPQGVNENNLDWVFPTIPDRRNIIDRFCNLSLTSRSNGFITMLAPLRDHLSPQDPRKSSLLCTTRDCYSSKLRLLGDLDPDQPGFKESRWITSEDVNVEHLINTFISLDTDSDDIWVTCADFMRHLYWHKRRLTVLGPKIEGLLDGHSSKCQCSYRLSLLFKSLGNHVEAKQLLTHTLELERRQGNDDRVARTLRYLADTNRMLDLYEEGIRQSKEALEIYEQLGDRAGQGKCWIFLGRLLVDDDQLDAAEEAASHAMELFRDQHREFWICVSHQLLGEIYRKKGKREKAIQHYEAAISIASPFDWHNRLFWIHWSLAWLFYDEGEFGDAQSHTDQSKLHAVDDTHCLGRAMELQAWIWSRQGRLEEAKAEVLGALEIFEKLGATRVLEGCRDFLRSIELVVESSSSSGESDGSARSPSPKTAPYSRLAHLFKRIKEKSRFPITAHVSGQTSHS